MRHSSLDTDIRLETDRFDEKIDGEILPMRDEYDKKVSQTAIQLKNVLNNLLSERVVQTKLPYSHKRAVHNTFAINYYEFVRDIKCSLFNFMLRFFKKSTQASNIVQLDELVSEFEAFARECIESHGLFCKRRYGYLSPLQ